MNLSGNPIDYLLAFLGGVLISFTPCTYPLIPITAGFIGAAAGGSKKRGFSLSLVYVTGIAITYSLLGLAASLTGKIFGAIVSHPAVYILTGSVVLLFGLSMSGAFTFFLPNFIKLPKLEKGNYISTLLLGLVSGLIIGPCLTPVLGAILGYLVIKKSIFYGMSLLFVFAFGMGFLLILVGTSSAILVNLPKAGKWLSRIKKAFAFILVLAGVYFIVSGVGRFYAHAAEPLAAARETAADFQLADLSGKEFSLAGYKGKQPALLFFWTTWCPFCRKEMKVLSDDYAKIAQDNVAVLTVNIGEPAGRVADFAKKHAIDLIVLLDTDTAVANSYDVLGIPTYILIDKNGNIILREHRFPQQYKELLAGNGKKDK